MDAKYTKLLYLIIIILFFISLTAMYVNFFIYGNFKQFSYPYETPNPYDFNVYLN